MTAFSTREERQLLAEKPDAARDPRQERVARVLERLEALVEPMDPGMSRSSRSPVVHRSAFLRIQDVWIDGDEARIELESLSFGPDESQFYVGRYEELAGEDRLPDLDELLARRPDATRVSDLEVHRWRRVDGSWQRAAATQYFIEQ